MPSWRAISLATNKASAGFRLFKEFSTVHSFRIFIQVTGAIHVLKDGEES